MRCKICGRPAVASPHIQRTPLCAEHFLQFFDRRVVRTVEEYSMFNPREDRIGVLISGGKDSASLLACLKRNWPGTQLIALHLNLGIGYYSEEAEEAARFLCEGLGVPLYVYNLKEEEGFAMDEFVLTRYRRKICSVCGFVKRRIFSKMAARAGVTCVATAHHLDDVVSTMMLCFVNGDLKSLARLYPVEEPLVEGQVRKVKPLVFAPEPDIKTYANLLALPFCSETCPHREDVPRFSYKKMLDQAETWNRQIKCQLLSVFLKKLIPLLKGEETPQVNVCKRCGGATDSSSGLCGMCRRLQALEGIRDRRLEVTASECEEGEGEIVRVGKEEALWKDSKLKKRFSPYRDKKIYIAADLPSIGYRITLRLRKLGFEAFNIRDPENL